MCGIAGILHLNNQPADKEVIQRMTNAMAHRGPDADNIFVEGEIALGHRRLSIIDLSDTANQPFTDHSGRYVIVFNGEIYNYKEVKALLPDYPFRTASDTEAIIAAYDRWGIKCVDQLKGMFAFAIWDRQENTLTLVRDRLGVKPIYYYQDEKHFIFASEIRSILATGLVKRKINTVGLLEYFSYQSVGSPLSPVDGIRQLMAGSWIKIRNGAVQQKQYWDATTIRKNFDFSNSTDIQKKIRELLTKSVERRLVSDVPVGAFLSGGIDSSVVVGLMAEVSRTRLDTFTVAFGEKEFNESEYAAIVAKKFHTRHTNINLRPATLLDELENALNAMDTPSGDGINTYVVSKAIREAGITVALSGIGGDELFAGYPFFTSYQKLQKGAFLYKGTGGLRHAIAALLLQKGNSRKERVQQLFTAPSPAIENVYPIFRQIITPRLIQQLTTLPYNRSTALISALKESKENLKPLPLLSQVSVAEYMGYTQQTLLKDTDQMSMAVSLEVREPFFDHELVEFVLAVPDPIKQPIYPKSLLVESLKPLLPDEIVHRKKQGFLFPWKLWMKKELRSFCEEQLKALAAYSFINEAELKKYWNRFVNNDASVRWTEIWLFVVLSYWLQKNGIEE